MVIKISGKRVNPIGLAQVSKYRQWKNLPPILLSFEDVNQYIDTHMYT